MFRSCSRSLSYPKVRAVNRFRAHSSHPTSSRKPADIEISQHPKKRPGPPSVLKQALKLTASQAAGEVLAYSTAEEYDVRALQRRLADAGYSKPMYNVLGEAIWVPEWSPRLPDSEGSSKESEQDVDGILGGEVFVFESGELVSSIFRKCPFRRVCI